MKIIIFLFFVNVFLIYSQVKEYYIYCDKSDFEYIYKNPYEDNYIPITLIFNGKEYKDIRMRIRGDDTRMHPKKSLKLKFDGEPFFDGKKTLNFNAEYEDESYISQFLASFTYRKAGYPCFDAEFARLYLNDEFLGLYLRIENMDEQFLERNSFMPIGNLYKATEDDACLSVYDNIDSLWEKKTNENQSWHDLYDLRDSLYLISDEDYYEFAKRNFDYEKMVEAIALNMILAHGSTYYHNYYMYHDFRNNKWIYFPWDMDKTFFKYGYLYPYNISSSHYSPDNPFLERALINGQIFNDIKNKIDFFVNDFFYNEFYDPIIDSLKNLIYDSVEQDTTDNIEDIQYWLDAIEKQKKFISERYNSLQWQFNNLPTQFKVEFTFGDYFLPVKFVWHPAKSPNNSALTYTVYFGKTPNLKDEYLFKIDNITDTTYLFEELVEPGKYYWKVTANNNSWEVDGFNYPNMINIREKNKIPCNISKPTQLTKENSPYFIDCDVSINAPLVILPGVDIYVSAGKSIYVNDTLMILGSAEQQVNILPYGQEGLGTINLQNAYFEANYSTIQDILIDAKNSDIYLDNLKMFVNWKKIDNQHAYVVLNKGFLSFKNSFIRSNDTCEGIRVIEADGSLLENLIIQNAPDAIEFINLKNGKILNCKIWDSNDDGIDCNNCDSMLISGNFIFNILDKGISLGNEGVGPSSDAIIRRNVIANCDVGIAIKDSSNAIIENNTVYNAEDGILVYQKTVGIGGAFADIRNCIVSKCMYPITIDYLSNASINYCLNDTMIFVGNGNIAGDPKFKDPNDYNFYLQEGSPAIDAGDPNSKKDYDGSRADIGALPFGIDDLKANLPKIVINEINYNSADDFDTGDWVELYNNDSMDIDLSGWIFKDNDFNHNFQIPEGTILKKSEYLVLTRTKELFRKLFPNVKKVIGDFDFGLSGNGDQVRLYNSEGMLIDSVSYGVKEPWSEAADGQGMTLELISPDLDNTLPESWKASVKLYGTPGEVNSVSLDVIYSNCFNMNVYPNPAKNIFNLDYENSLNSNLKIYLTDLKGKFIKNLYEGNPGKGKVIIQFDVTDINTGIYFLNLVSDKEHLTHKVIIE